MRETLVGAPLLLGILESPPGSFLFLLRAPVWSFVAPTWWASGSLDLASQQPSTTGAIVGPGLRAFAPCFSSSLLFLHFRAALAPVAFPQWLAGSAVPPAFSWNLPIGSTHNPQ